VNGLFHALGTSRLTAGTDCDSCCETAWDTALGPVGGADPEEVAESDLIISWGCDLKAVNDISGSPSPPAAPMSGTTARDMWKMNFTLIA
jgi:hypothetical protein